MLTFRNTIIFFAVAMIFILGVDYNRIVPFWVYLIPVIVAAILISWGSYFIQSGFFVKALTSGPPSSNEIAITFDDGPHENTPALLDVLRKYDVQAAFFCIGKNISGKEHILKRAFAEGHLIGNHSYSHHNLIDLWPLKKIKADVLEADAEIQRVINKQTSLFRPPFGVTTPVISRLVKDRKYTVIGWNVRSYDTTIKSRDRLLKRIFRLMGNGSVILLHDSTPGIEIVVEEVLRQAQRKNLKVVSIEKLFGVKAYD